MTAYLINNPTELVSLSTLADLGVLYWKLDASLGPDDPTLKKIRNNRGYNFIDYVSGENVVMQSLRRDLGGIHQNPQSERKIGHF